jgi:multicomponent Na+:H+ antiporter subunit B
MAELYLRVLDRVMTPILLVLTLFLLLRGHNLPGGGFIAGLTAATAFELQILSRGPDVVQDSLGRYLQPMMGIGLLISVLSALFGLVDGVFFTGIWGKFVLGTTTIDLGSPVFFDLGVFLVVMSVTTSYLLGLNQAAFHQPRPNGAPQNGNGNGAGNGNGHTATPTAGSEDAS